MTCGTYMGGSSFDAGAAAKVRFLVAPAVVSHTSDFGLSFDLLSALSCKKSRKSPSSIAP